MIANTDPGQHPLKDISYTKKEIFQQPALWLKTMDQLKEIKDEMELFLINIKRKHDQVKVIFTGAGTSAFVGDTIVPYIRSEVDGQKWIVECIPTTNIVSTPYYYLHSEIPTIMVSFARSGNSPESIAAVEIAENVIQDFYEITITCNGEGALANRKRSDAKQLIVVLPEEANDKGFAMTSSYTTMMLSALYLFSALTKKNISQMVQEATQASERILHQQLDFVHQLVHEPFTKLVYLGSGLFEGLACEAALKFLELTAGKFPTLYDTTLGFRHGPKSIIDKGTMTIVFLSNHPYTRKYDLDMLKELYDERERGKVIAITGKDDPFVKENSDLSLSIGPAQTTEDIWLTFPYIVVAQLFAMFQSIDCGISPDNPSPEGVVNRVVQGVNIYPYGEGK